MSSAENSPKERPTSATGAALPAGLLFANQGGPAVAAVATGTAGPLVPVVAGATGAGAGAGPGRGFIVAEGRRRQRAFAARVERNNGERTRATSMIFFPSRDVTNWPPELCRKEAEEAEGGGGGERSLLYVLP